MKSTKILMFAAIAMLACASAFAAHAPDLAASLGIQLDPTALAGAAMVGMTIFTEGNHAGEHLISEVDDGTLSRDVVTILSGQNLTAGTVLGKVRGAATSAALGTNTGDGVMGAVTAGAGALEGDYKLTIIEAAANAGAFLVEDPNGVIIGHGNVAAAFAAGGLSFTLADGATDFAAGDSFTITVAAGTKYAAFDPAATDGTEAAVAVLYADVDASAADTPGVVHSRLCEVASSKLTWGAAANAAQKAAALAQLAANFIIAR